MTDKKTEEEALEQVPYIWYLVTFKDQTKALLDFENKVNVMNSAFTSQLGLKIQKTNVGAQKIDGTTLETYRMVVSNFFVSNKNGRERFFKENFLLAEVKPKIVLEMCFLTMSNADVNFQARLTIEVLHCQRRTFDYQTGRTNREEKVRSCSS